MSEVKVRGRISVPRVALQGEYKGAKTRVELPSSGPSSVVRGLAIRRSSGDFLSL